MILVSKLLRGPSRFTEENIQRSHFSRKRIVQLGSTSQRRRSKEGSEMLVLSRKLGEKIYINDNICITVVDIDRGKIRLGIEAPREVPIFRKELLAQPAPAGADVPMLAAKG
jgi:carbon storage regulator